MTPALLLLPATGLLLLLVGTWLLVRNLPRLAERLRLPYRFAGLALLVCGNGLPALVVAMTAVQEGHGDIAVGAALGGALLALLCLLGGAALLFAPSVSPRLRRRELPLLAVASLLVLALTWDGWLSRLNGAPLLALLLLYLALRLPRPRESEEPDDFPGTRGWLRTLLMLLGGLLALLLGAMALVEGASELAFTVGLSERVVGLTLVAGICLLPTLVSALLAVVRRRHERTLGLLLGAGLFNLTAVLGLTALSAPHPLSISPNSLDLDLPGLLLTTLLALPLCLFGARPWRWQGLLLLACYVGYAGYLLLFAMGRPQAARIEALAFYGLPLALLLLLAGALFELWRQRR